MKESYRSKFTIIDYILAGLSMSCFIIAVVFVSVGMTYGAIAVLGIFGILLLLLLRRQILKPEPLPEDSEEYKALQMKYQKEKKVSSVKIDILNAKVEEGARERKLLEKMINEKNIEN